MFYDTANATRIKSNTSLWVIGNLMVGSGKELVHHASSAVTAGQLLPELSKSRHFYYVQDHAGGRDQGWKTASESALLQPPLASLLHAKLFCSDSSIGCTAMRQMRHVNVLSSAHTVNNAARSCMLCIPCLA